jgi:hypothetical protein
MSMDSTFPPKYTIWQTGLKKEDPTNCCLQEIYLIEGNKHWLRIKGLKKICQGNGPPKKAQVAILIYGKGGFKLTVIKQDKEVHFILIKGEINQKEIIIINLYVTNVSEPNFIKHTPKDLKAHIHSGSGRL